MLPFQNMSGDPDQEYFADGMVEDIITALSRFKSLFVIARNSSFTYRGKAVDIKHVGRELGVRYVLEGSVRKSGNRVRVTGQLIEAATGAHLWADKYDGTLDDLFVLQDSVAASVVGAVIPQLDKASRDALKRKPPESWDSYDHYLRGLTLVERRTVEASVEAQAAFQKAFELDPSFALAYVMHARTTFQRRNSLRVALSEEERLEALRLATLSTSLAPDDDLVLAWGSTVLLILNNEFERAAALADRAVAVNPNSAAAWSAKGWADTLVGEKLQQAFDAFDRALRLSPLDPENLRYCEFGKACSCFLLGRHEEGLAWAKQMLARDPNRIGGLWMVAGNASLLKQMDEARGAGDRVRAIFPSLRASEVRKTLVRSRKPEHLARLNAAVDALGLPE